MSNLDRQVRGAKINPMDNPFGDERACFLSKIVFKDSCSKCSTWHPKTLYYTYRHKTVILTGTSQLYLQGQVSYTPTPSSPAGRHRSSALCVPTGRVRGRGKRYRGLLPDRRRDAEDWPY